VAVIVAAELVDVMPCLMTITCPAAVTLSNLHGAVGGVDDSWLTANRYGYGVPLTHAGRGGTVCPQRSNRSGLAFSLKYNWKLSPAGMRPKTVRTNVMSIGVDVATVDVVFDATDLEFVDDDDVDALMTLVVGVGVAVLPPQADASVSVSVERTNRERFIVELDAQAAYGSAVVGGLGQDVSRP
jgi:hypothetical protein